MAILGKMQSLPAADNSREQVLMAAALLTRTKDRAAPPLLNQFPGQGLFFKERAVPWCVRT